MKPYTDWTPEEVAALFLKHGLLPRRGDFYTTAPGYPAACAMGALAIETGVSRDSLGCGYVGEGADAYSIFNTAPTPWQVGVTNGFDGVIMADFRDQTSAAQFDAGFALGRRVAELVGLTEATS